MATFFHDGDPGCTRQNWNGCDPNGGCNSSQVSSFAPSNLNVSSWFASMKDLGATSAVLTAKHGCGFLGWQTKTTLPDGTPYPYHVPANLPVLEQFVANAKAAGIGYGFYYSLTNNFFLNVLGHNVQPANTLLPGQASVTQSQYEDLAIAQMTELWTLFGNLTEIWLDGGCGELCDRVSTLLATTNARNAVAFNGGGGTSAHPVRWCGTEGGNPSGWPTIWSTATCGWCPSGSGSGSAPNASGAAWNPSGVDVTLQQGDHWFYMPGVPIHPLSDMVQVYHRSVGANGHLELDFAIDRTGGIDPAHAAGYRAFGNWIRACYGKPALGSGTLSPATGTNVTVELPGGSSGSTFDRVVMTEDQRGGQLVYSYQVDFLPTGAGAKWQPFSSGVSIGSKRIDAGAAPVTAVAVRLSITSAFGAPTASIAVMAPDGCAVSEHEY